MANICAYKVMVKGKKNACYAFFGSMSSLDMKEIMDESGTEENYTMIFEGNCKWSVDAYCTPWDKEFPVQLPEDYNEAYQKAEDDYWYNTVQERSKMFEVEVFCNSADIEAYPIFPEFEYYRNGIAYDMKCPEELSIDIDDDVEEGMVRCVVCGVEIPIQDSIEIDEDVHFCQGCYDETFG